jgi:hypothetical protein
MELGRRGFLGTLFGAAAWALLPSGPIPSAFLSEEIVTGLITPVWVTHEVARQFMTSLKFTANFNRSYDSTFANVGDTVSYRLPKRYNA